MTTGHPGSRIHALRKAAKLTLRQVSERTGLDVSHLARIEKSQRGVSFEQAIAIAEALGVEITDLKPGDDEPSEPPAAA